MFKDRICNACIAQLSQFSFFIQHYFHSLVKTFFNSETITKQRSVSRLKGGYLRKVEFESHMILFHATVTINRYRINGTPFVFPDGLIFIKHLLLVSHTHVLIYLSERSRMHEKYTIGSFSFPKQNIRCVINSVTAKIP